MGNGYTRQSAADIVTGNVVEAGPLNAEFNQMQDAFHETSGHSHDGTTGEGPKISLNSSVTGILQPVQGGTGGINKLNATTAPTAADDINDGYAVGSVWADVTNDKAYLCVDSTASTAVWKIITGSTATDAIASLTPAADRVPYYTGTTTAALAPFTAFARTLVDDADATTARATLGAVIGTNVLAYDAGLQNLAGVTFAADKSVYWSADNVAVAYDVSTFARTLLDDTSQAAMQSTLALVPGTHVQAYDGDLAAIAALSGTNNIYYRSAANTWTSVTIGSGLTFTGGTLDAAAAASDATITAIAGLTPTTDQGIYFTGTDVAATFALTAFARTILDDANQATVQATLGLVPGTNVQAFDSDLTAVAGLATNGLIARTGTGAMSTRTLTAPAAGITVSNGDGVAGNPTLALADDLSALEALSGTNTIYYRSGASAWTAVTVGAGLTFTGGTLDAASSGGLTIGTPQATTSGTTKDFTIPAGVTMINVFFNGVTVSANSTMAIQLGDAGGIEATGYSGTKTTLNAAPSIAIGANNTSWFEILANLSTSGSGVATLYLYSGTTWAIASDGASSNGYKLVGFKTLSQDLTTVRILAGNTMLTGAVNVSYQ